MQVILSKSCKINQLSSWIIVPLEKISINSYTGSLTFNSKMVGKVIWVGIWLIKLNINTWHLFFFPYPATHSKLAIIAIPAPGSPQDFALVSIWKTFISIGGLRIPVLPKLLLFYLLSPVNGHLSPLLSTATINEQKRNHTKEAKSGWFSNSRWILIWLAKNYFFFFLL